MTHVHTHTRTHARTYTAEGALWSSFSTKLGSIEEPISPSSVCSSFAVEQTDSVALPGASG